MAFIRAIGLFPPKEVHQHRIKSGQRRISRRRMSASPHREPSRLRLKLRRPRLLSLVIRLHRRTLFLPVFSAITGFALRAFTFLETELGLELQ